MKEIVLIIRPEKLEVLKSILDQMKCGGMTISTVMGCGAQKGAVEDEYQPASKGESGSCC